MLAHRKGEKAWLTGLASRPDLAGKKVSLLGALDRERGRYPVEVHTSEEKLRIKPENLCFVEHTEMHLICAEPGDDTVRLLVAIQRGDDVNARMRGLCSPISLAAAKGNVEQVKMLIEHSADVNIVGEYRKTALHIDRGRRQREAVGSHVECLARDGEGVPPAV